MDEGDDRRWPVISSEDGQPMLPFEPLSSDHETPLTKIPFPVAMLAFGAVPGLGMRSLRTLVRAYGDALGGLLESSPDDLYTQLARLKLSAAARVAGEITGQRSRLLEEAQAKAAKLAASHVRVLGPAELPARLASLKDGPLWLFVEGDSQALFAGPHIAVVGTRRATHNGLRATFAAVRSLAAYPITVVSGLANGIDAAAHTAAIRDGVRNVAFLGHGTDTIFPAETADLRSSIVETGGAVVSEYMPSERYRKAQFVQRNRLQAGLADAVVAVEGERSGGTAHTIRFASAYGRSVTGFVWPGAGDLTSLIENLPTGKLIEIFSIPGLRAFDAFCRRIAESYGHQTYGLRLIERQLAREMQLRDLPVEDLKRLQQRIDDLLRE